MKRRPAIHLCRGASESRVYIARSIQFQCVFWLDYPIHIYFNDLHKPGHPDTLDGAGLRWLCGPLRICWEQESSFKKIELNWLVGNEGGWIHWGISRQGAQPPSFPTSRTSQWTKNKQTEIHSLELTWLRGPLSVRQGRQNVFPPLSTSMVVAGSAWLKKIHMHSENDTSPGHP